MSQIIKPSFETIIASGYRGSWAHGVASDKKIQKGELIVIDFGSFYHGYTADITRTVALVLYYMALLAYRAHVLLSQFHDQYRDQSTLHILAL